MRKIRWQRGNGRAGQGEHLSQEKRSKNGEPGDTQSQLLLLMDIITAVASSSDMPGKEVIDLHS